MRKVLTNFPSGAVIFLFIDNDGGTMPTEQGIALALEE